MNRSSVSYAVAALALAAALGLAAACKSTPSGNNCGSGGAPPNLVGTFSLLSYTLGSTTIPAPPASGTLRFHASTYGVNLSIPTGTGGNQTIIDSGTYAIVGSTCIQESSVMGQPQFTGSFEVIADTLHVSGTAGGQIAASVWLLSS